MPAYGSIDLKLPGLKYGLDSRVLSKRVAENSGISYGRPVFGYVGNDNDIFLFHNNVAVMTFDADFVTGNSIVITIDGTAVTAVPFNSDHDTTMDDLKDQIEADISGASVTLTDGVNNRELTVTIEDDSDRTIAEAITGGGSQATGTPSYSSSMVFVGFSMFTQKESAGKTDLSGTVITAADNYYEYKESANIMIDGWIWAVIGATVQAKTAAYVIGTGSTQGLIDDSSSGNTSLTGVTIESNATYNGSATAVDANLALIRVNK